MLLGRALGVPVATMAGWYYGAFGTLISIYGFLMGFVIDNLGVRLSLLLGGLLLLVARLLLAFTADPLVLKLVLFGVLPAGEALGIPVLKHLHHVWPHYHTDKAGVRSLYILIHGWSAGKFAVLKHAPLGAPSEPACFTTSDGVKHPYPAKPGQPSEFKHVDVRAQ